jgi:hypothetical protein
VDNLAREHEQCPQNPTCVLVTRGGQQKQGSAPEIYPEDRYGSREDLVLMVKMANEVLVRAGWARNA